MNKALLKNLKNDVYCRIKPSKRHGVGVFAIKNIPKNKNPFRITGENCIKQRVLNIKREDVNKLDKEVKKMVEDFYHEQDGIFGIPYRGLNSNDISFYMNTSKKPNIGLRVVNG